MSKDFQDHVEAMGTALARNSHTTVENIARLMPKKINQLNKQELNGKAAQNIKQYLADKKTKTKTSQSKLYRNNKNNEKNSDVANRAWPMEHCQANRGDGAFKAARFQATPKGATVGAIRTAPFCILYNGLRVMRGEISTGAACRASLEDLAMDAGVGGVSALTVTTVMTSCPPIAVALTTLSPTLIVVGGAEMVKQFFAILEFHKEKNKEYYDSLTPHDLDFLTKLEANLEAEHQKKLQKIGKSRALRQQLSRLPVKPDVAAALKRHRASVALAQAHGVQAIGSKVLLSEQRHPASGIENRASS